MPSRHEWDLRHRQAAAHPSPPPAAFLLECFGLLPRPHPASRALDLACGAGHNSLYLAERGWPVLAVDFSPAALDRAASLAAGRVRLERCAPGSVPGRFAGLSLLEAGLERLPLPEASFDLILCFQYLDRAAFHGIERALAPGGHLVYETFTEHQLAFADGPRSPAHLLRPGELRSAFPLLDVLFYRECLSPRAVASLLARRS